MFDLLLLLTGVTWQGVLQAHYPHAETAAVFAVLRQEPRPWLLRESASTLVVEGRSVSAGLSQSELAASLATLADTVIVHLRDTGQGERGNAAEPRRRGRLVLVLHARQPMREDSILFDLDVVCLGRCGMSYQVLVRRSASGWSAEKPRLVGVG